MKNKELLIGIVCFSILFFLTIGYAAYDQVLKLNGNLTLQKQGTIQIIALDRKSSDLPTNAGGISLVNGDLIVKYNFTVSKEELEYTETYMITIQNASPYDYNFSGFNIEPKITITGASTSEAGAVITYEYTDLGTSNQVAVGGVIPSKETKVVGITLHIKVVSEQNNTNIGIEGGANVNTSTDNTGSFYAGIVDNPITLDLRGEGTIDCFDVEVTNTYKASINYYFSLTNNNFELVDSTGSSLGNFTIGEASDESSNNVDTVEVCMKVKEGSQFLSESVKNQVVVNPTGLSNFSTGTITISVDKTENITYEGRPEVENLTFQTVKYDTENSVLITNASWLRKDTDGLTMKNWYINLYSQDTETGTNTLITTYEVAGDANISNYELSISSSILNNTNFKNAITNNHPFFIEVYGVDEAGNSGENYCGQGNSYCVQSSAISLKYQFTLTATGNATLTNTTNNTATVYLNNPFTSVITSSSNYALNGITVTMGGNDLTTSDPQQYTYLPQENSSSTADFNILENVINDDITVTVATYYNGWSCLVKGTKIKVYDGYKNIEDITYDDLLVAYSYELGREVYVYPIKIEEEGTGYEYQKITFSDGAILKTFGDHGIFSKDLNRYVSVLNKNDFHVGTNVIKVINNKLKTVKVVNIETIKEEIKYYNITSTRYLNVLANDILTTDPILPISNIFTFTNNLTWGNDRYDYLNTNDFIPYEYLKDYFPKYLYDGIRMGEAKHLINQGIISVTDYVTRFGVMKFVDIPRNEKNENIWKVTTSLDLENNKTGNYYTEGSLYKLPKAKEYFNKKFLGWYLAADNTLYQESDLVEVKYGMHFEAIYEDSTMFTNTMFNK